MSCVHTGPAQASHTQSSATNPSRLVRRVEWPTPALTSRSVTLAAVLLMSAVVASAPRTASAQATTPVHHTVRHTLRAEVGTVTQVEISSPWRPSSAEFGGQTRDQQLVARRWMHHARVRSNVRTVVLLEPAAEAPGNNASSAWHVVDANGQLVPWRSEPVVLSHELEAGRHEVPIVWVAPHGATSPPKPVVRLRIVTDAR